MWRDEEDEASIIETCEENLILKLFEEVFPLVTFLKKNTKTHTFPKKKAFFSFPRHRRSTATRLVLPRRRQVHRRHLAPAAAHVDLRGRAERSQRASGGARRWGSPVAFVEMAAFRNGFS